MQWDAEQKEVTDSELRSWPWRDALRASFEAQRHVSKPGGRSQPVRHGLFKFHTERTAGSQHESLFVTDESGEHLLIDPAEFGPESTIDWFHPSPQGTFVAYGASQNGNEQSVLRVVRSATGQDLGITVPHASFSEIAWLPDETGFYFTAGLASDHEDGIKRLFRLLLDKREPDAPEPIELNDPYAHPQITDDGRFLTVTVSWEKPKLTWYRDLHAGDGWRPFLAHLDGETYGAFQGHTMYVLTTEGAPNGRVLAIDMENPESRQEVVAESAGVLRSVIALNDRLVMTELHGGATRLRVKSLQTGADQLIELPGPGTIDVTMGTSTSPFTVDGNFVHFDFYRFDTALSLRLDVDSLELQAADGGPVPELKSDLTVRRAEAPGKDGVKVPYWLVHRNDLDVTQPQPTLVYAYGGWNIPIGPFPLAGAGLAPFLDAGGIYVVANLRGGPELGRDWWLNGRREHKQNTFDDLYAVAEHLVHQRTSDPDRLAVHGRSNGGLLTAVAVTQRPELFTAVVSEVPLTDMLRAMDHPYLASYKVEYGDPAEPEFERILASYSPIHNVKPGTTYPATLLLSAASDLRCQPWNGRKLALLLQKATSGDAPILFRLAEGGHGGQLSVDQWLSRRTDVIGFIMQQLDLQPATNPSQERNHQ